MKNIFLALTLFVATVAAHAQSSYGFGIKGGLNYNSNGNYFESINHNAEHPDKNVGFHLGVFGKFGDRLYIRPELVYTQTKSDYNGDDFKVKKIDLPVLVGIRVIGPLSAFAGPAFQYIIKSNFDGIKVDDFDKDISVGFNFGLGFNLRKFGIDLRYERGFSKNEAQFINNNGLDNIAQIDARPSQLILSASYLF